MGDEVELSFRVSPQAADMIAVAAWKRKAMLAEEVLVLCYKARDIMHKYCVHLYVKAKTEKVLDSAEAVTKLCDYVEGVLVPMDEPVFKAIDEITWRAMANFGDDLAGVLTEIRSAYRSMVYDFYGVQMNGLSEEGSPIAYSILTIEPTASEPKIVKVRVDGAVSTLQQALRPVLDGQPSRS